MSRGRQPEKNPNLSQIQMFLYVLKSAICLNIVIFQSFNTPEKMYLFGNDGDDGRHSLRNLSPM